jgi:hypothetical protein
MLLNIFRKYRCTPRTESCKKYEKETIKRPGSSNFISHSSKCKSVPPEMTWAAFEARNGAEVGEGDAQASTSGAAGSSGVAPGLEAQRSFMDNFSARGLQNPAKVVTNKGFREHLVKGLIEDDLPYSLGEKAGMRKLFTYVLPRSISCPSHQTVRRDLDILYGKVDAKVNHTLQVHKNYCDIYTLTDSVLFSQTSRKSQSPVTCGPAKILFMHSRGLSHFGLMIIGS